MTLCPKLAEGDRVRLTRLDNCGAPVEGEGNAMVDECWASVQMEPNIDDGTDIEFKGMNGRNCGFKQGCPTLRGYEITGQFFSANPELINLAAGHDLYLGYDDAVIGWIEENVVCTGGFALEIWQNLLTDECPEDAEGQWFYWVLPWVGNGRLGNIEVNEEGVTFELSAHTRTGHRWGRGPYLVLDNAGTPSHLPTAIAAASHRLAVVTTVAPPEASCDLVTVGPTPT